MVWKIDGEQYYESKKIIWETVPYTRGRGLDVGCGAEKIWPHAIGVDNCIDTALFDVKMKPDVVANATEMPMFASNYFDWVFSSHMLEHCENYGAVLKEMWRVIRNGGYLILYLPHCSFYPNIGTEGANPDHRHDFMPSDIVDAMKNIGSWDLIENQERNQDNEYSFFQVYKKIPCAQ